MVTKTKKAGRPRRPGSGPARQGFFPVVPVAGLHKSQTVIVNPCEYFVRLGTSPGTCSKDDVRKAQGKRDRRLSGRPMSFPFPSLGPSICLASIASASTAETVGPLWRCLHVRCSLHQVVGSWLGSETEPKSAPHSRAEHARRSPVHSIASNRTGGLMTCFLLSICLSC